MPMCPLYVLRVSEKCLGSMIKKKEKKRKEKKRKTRIFLLWKKVRHAPKTVDVQHGHISSIEKFNVIEHWSLLLQ